MRPALSRHRQGGSVIVTVAATLLLLLGIMGIALDFGRLFVVKTELQTAVDSCALAAAQELDGATDSQTRAKNAGTTSGNLNKIQFQGAAAGITRDEVTFSDTLDGTYSIDFTPVADAKYAKCMHTKSGLAPWLLQAFGAVSGDATFGAANGVQALAVASRVPSQTNCALPVGICKKTPNYQPGEWLAGAVNSGGATTGQFRWLDLTPGDAGGTNELKSVLQGGGQCNLPGTNTVVGKPGNNGGAAAEAYNSRFGIKNSQKTWNPSVDGTPDRTGYSWYLQIEPTQPPYPNKYPSYIGNRANQPFQGNGKVKGNPTPNSDISGLNLTGGSEFLDANGLAVYGASNRRVVVAPIIDCDTLKNQETVRIDGLACVLLLHPIGAGANSTAGVKMWVEYIGLANIDGSPCTTSGLAGGTGGPLVSALMR